MLTGEPDYRAGEPQAAQIKRMCNFITQHSHRCRQWWRSLRSARWLQEDPPEMLPVNRMLISLPKPFNEFGRASNGTSPGPSHPATPPPRSRASSRSDSCYSGGFVEPHTQTVWAKLVCMLLVLVRVLVDPMRVDKCSHSTGSGTLEIFMDESRISLYRPDGKQGVWHHVGERFADCWSSGPGWWFSYGTGRRRTVNTAHDHPRPHLAKISTQVPEAENVPVPADFQQTSRTCRGLFGMFWIGIYSSVFQFLPISSGFTNTMKRSNIPPLTTWSTRRRCVTLCEASDTDWYPPPSPCTTQYSRTANLIVAFYCG